MLPSIFEKQKICSNRSKSFLIVNPILSEKQSWSRVRVRSRE